MASYEQLPVCLKTSSEKDVGRHDVLAHIARLRGLYNLRDHEQH